ncbi:unnamed protein product [Phytomonas sp. Hart1]|nr:unnamed protein product [Phytomonas sp. Hart1]|eukprot:CCW69650.1 unnamed protein product [Phytomonas sp. isolate Hart1]
MGRPARQPRGDPRGRVHEPPALRHLRARPRQLRQGAGGAVQALPRGPGRPVDGDDRADRPGAAQDALQLRGQDHRAVRRQRRHRGLHRRCAVRHRPARRRERLRRLRGSARDLPRPLRPPRRHPGPGPHHLRHGLPARPGPAQPGRGRRPGLLAAGVLPAALQVRAGGGRVPRPGAPPPRPARRPGAAHPGRPLPPRRLPRRHHEDDQERPARARREGGAARAGRAGGALPLRQRPAAGRPGRGGRGGGGRRPITGGRGGPARGL